MEFSAIPGGDAARLVRNEAGFRNIVFAENSVRPVGVFVERLNARLGVRYRIKVRRRIIARAVVEIITFAGLSLGRGTTGGDSQRQNENTKEAES